MFECFLSCVFQKGVMFEIKLTDEEIQQETQMRPERDVIADEVCLSAVE